jgi:hypothetical protein
MPSRTTKKVAKKKTVAEPQIHRTIRGAIMGDATHRTVYESGDEQALAGVLNKATHKRLTKAGVISGFAVPEE